VIPDTPAQTEAEPLMLPAFPGKPVTVTGNTVGLTPEQPDELV
jgi:hypothetical protein